MKAFAVVAYKGPLQELEVPEPIVDDHDVLVQVRVAGINGIDQQVLAGAFKLFLPYRLPQVLGNELAEPSSGWELRSAGSSQVTKCTAALA